MHSERTCIQLDRDWVFRYGGPSHPAQRAGLPRHGKPVGDFGCHANRLIQWTIGTRQKSGGRVSVGSIMETPSGSNSFSRFNNAVTRGT